MCGRGPLRRRRYRVFTERAVKAFNALIKLLRPNEHSSAWAAIATAEARNQRNSLMERLAAPQLTAAVASTLIVSIGQFRDSYCAAYQEEPGNDAVKRAKMQELQAELSAIINDLGQLMQA